MKTFISNASTAVRRSAAYWRMRSLEINLAAMREIYPSIEDMETRRDMHRAMRNASTALAAARADYRQFDQPGFRRVWDLA